MGPIDCTSALRPVISAVRLDEPALAVHVVRSYPVAQAMIGPILVTALGHHIQNTISSEKLFTAAPEGRVGQIDLAGAILEEHAVAGEVLQSGRPFRRFLEIVDSVTGSTCSGVKDTLKS